MNKGKWEEKEEKKLLALRASGMPINMIAKKLKHGQSQKVAQMKSLTFS